MLASHPLSLALAGLGDAPEIPAAPRAMIEWAAALGYRAIQLDATRQTLRPRDLDRSARRDLASHLRKNQLTLSGLDLFIPPDHFIDPAHIDRAAAAVRGGLELAADLTALSPTSIACVSVAFPPDIAADTLDELASGAEHLGAQIADFTIHGQVGTSETDTQEVGAGMGAGMGNGVSLGIGIDPAAFILRDLDPFQAVARTGSRLFAARLSDAAHGARIAQGSNGASLDQTAYAATLSVVGYTRPMILDLRNIPAQAAVAKTLAPSEG